jgi:hypothetical protein
MWAASRAVSMAPAASSGVSVAHQTPRGAAVSACAAGIGGAARVR